jgi:hypothetical protein
MGSPWYFVLYAVPGEDVRPGDRPVLYDPLADLYMPPVVVAGNPVAEDKQYSRRHRANNDRCIAFPCETNVAVDFIHRFSGDPFVRVNKRDVLRHGKQDPGDCRFPLWRQHLRVLPPGPVLPARPCSEHGPPFSPAPQLQQKQDCGGYQQSGDSRERDGSDYFLNMLQQRFVRRRPVWIGYIAQGRALNIPRQ